MIEKGYTAGVEQEAKYNLPWIIAADFDINLSLSTAEIRSMLEEYDAGHHTGMQLAQAASCIWDYTRGYPYLVSRIYLEIEKSRLNWDSDKTLVMAFNNCYILFPHVTNPHKSKNM